MKESQKCAIYAVLDEELYHWMLNDVNNRKMNLKSWLEQAIINMRKSRAAQKKGAK